MELTVQRLDVDNIKMTKVTTTDQTISIKELKDRLSRKERELESLNNEYESRTNRLTSEIQELTGVISSAEKQKVGEEELIKDINSI